MKMTKLIAIGICATAVTWLSVDFCKYPEVYLPTWKKQLKDEIIEGKTDSINLYESVYVDNNKDLFTHNFAIRETYQPEPELIVYEPPAFEDKGDKISLGVYKVTAYCSCKSCSGNWGNLTATGKRAKSNHTVAADTNYLPYGTKIIIDGVTYTVEDCGGGVKGKHIDIYFDTHTEVKKFGKQFKEVYIDKGVKNER